MYKCFRLFTVIFLLSSCGASDDLLFVSLNSKQPKVVSILPESGSLVAKDAHIEVMLSLPIDQQTVSEQSFFVQEVASKQNVLGTYALEQGDKVIKFTPEALQAGKEYQIVLNQKLQTKESVPLQGQGLEDFSRYVSDFFVQEQASSAPQATLQPDNEVDDLDLVERIRPELLVINELLYDVAGTDTNGELFVELFGTPETDITDYQIIFVNGDGGAITDIVQFEDGSTIPADGIFLLADARIGDGGASFIEEADYIDNFDPQNGPDCVQLVDQHMQLLDAVAYGASVSELAENGLPCAEGELAVDVFGGTSLSRIGGGDSDSNATDFISLDVPTPGLL